MLAATGCTPLIDPDAKGVILFDIGGGSSELVRLDRSPQTATGGPPPPKIAAGSRCRTASSRLAERHGGIEVTRDSFEAMVAEVAALIAPFAAKHGGDLDGVHLLGTSGTVTTIAGVHLDLHAL